jgi:hypothetical protein
MADYTQSPRAPEPHVSGWAIGGLAFAGTMLLLVGSFQIIAGLAALINDNFFDPSKDYAFDLSATGWGWIHLVIGLLMVLVGYGLLSRRPWAAVTGIIIASLSAINNFFFIPYYSSWAILVIAIDVWIIWSLTRPYLIES